MTAASPQACMAQFAAALIERDIDAALALLTDDVVFFYSNGTTIRGKTAFGAAMAESWNVVEDYRYETRDATWLADAAGAAAVIYGFAWSGRARGSEVSGGGRATRVFRDEGRGEGDWRVAHEHLSAGPWFRAEVP